MDSGQFFSALCRKADGTTPRSARWGSPVRRRPVHKGEYHGRVPAWRCEKA